MCANQATANMLNVDFLYADTNGSLNLWLKENYKSKKIFTFKNNEKLHSPLEKFNWELPSDNENANEVSCMELLICCIV